MRLWRPLVNWFVLKEGGTRSEARPRPAVGGRPGSGEGGGGAAMAAGPGPAEPNPFSFREFVRSKARSCEEAGGAHQVGPGRRRGWAPPR